jgi:hypothetical protein
VANQSPRYLIGWLLILFYYSNNEYYILSAINGDLGQFALHHLPPALHIMAVLDLLSLPYLISILQ